MSGMSGPQPTPGDVQRQAPKGLMPPELVDMIVPPLQFGISCGGAGAFTGAGAAILRDASPVVSGIMTGTQWAVLGTTYWFSRQVAIRGLGYGAHGRIAPSDKVKASAVASIPTGVMMSLGSGRTRSFGSSIGFCGVLAVGGQLAVNSWISRRGQPIEEGDGWLGSRWSPLQKLSDEEYVHVMDEKILRIDADIALIDERIVALREKQGQGDEK